MSNKNLGRARPRSAIAVGVLALAAGALGSSAVAGVGAAAPRPQGIVAVEQAEAFVSMTPTRILDTRGPLSGGPIGVAAARPLQAGEQLDLTVAGAGRAVPAGATAAVLNTTIDYDATEHSFLTVWPTGQPRPNASTNNALPGSEVSNVTVARLGAGGQISIYNQQGRVNLVFDVVGYLVPLSQVDGLGAAASMLRHGNGAPDAALGNDGDYYIDDSTHTLYGPKTGGTWPAGTSLVGPQGPAGGVVATRSAYGSGTVDLALGFAALDVGTDGPGFGTNITRTAPDTFTLAAPGVYEVTYRVSGATAVVGSEFSVIQSGAAVGPTVQVASVGAPAVDTVLVDAAAGDTISIGAGGVVQLGLLYDADIVITQLA